MRRLLNNCGHPVTALHRVRYGDVHLDDLEEGGSVAVEAGWGGQLELHALAPSPNPSPHPNLYPNPNLYANPNPNPNPNPNANLNLYPNQVGGAAGRTQGMGRGARRNGSHDHSDINLLAEPSGDPTARRVGCRPGSRASGGGGRPRLATRTGQTGGAAREPWRRCRGGAGGAEGRGGGDGGGVVARVEPEAGRRRSGE